MLLIKIKIYWTLAWFLCYFYWFLGRPLDLGICTGNALCSCESLSSIIQRWVITYLTGTAASTPRPAQMHIQGFRYLYLLMFIFTDIYIYRCLYLQMFIFTDVYIYRCIYTVFYIYIYICCCYFLFILYYLLCNVRILLIKPAASIPGPAHCRDANIIHYTLYI